MEGFPSRGFGSAGISLNSSRKNEKCGKSYDLSFFLFGRLKCREVCVEIFLWMWYHKVYVQLRRILQ